MRPYGRQFSFATYERESHSNGIVSAEVKREEIGVSIRWISHRFREGRSLRAADPGSEAGAYESSARKISTADGADGADGWMLGPRRARVVDAEFNARHSLRPLGSRGRHFNLFLDATQLELSGDRQADLAGFIPRKVNGGVTSSGSPLILVAKGNHRGEQRPAAFPQFGAGACNHTKARTTLDPSADHPLTRRFPLNTNLRNVGNACLTSLRDGSQTPADARPR